MYILLNEYILFYLTLTNIYIMQVQTSYKTTINGYEVTVMYNDELRQRIRRAKVFKALSDNIRKEMMNQRTLKQQLNF